MLQIWCVHLYDLYSLLIQIIICVTVIVKAQTVRLEYAYNGVGKYKKEYAYLCAFYLQFIICDEGRNNVVLHVIRCVIASGARISTGTVHFSDGRSGNESRKNCSVINGRTGRVGRVGRVSAGCDTSGSQDRSGNTQTAGCDGFSLRTDVIIVWRVNTTHTIYGVHHAGGKNPGGSLRAESSGWYAIDEHGYDGVVGILCKSRKRS